MESMRSSHAHPKRIRPHHYIINDMRKQYFDAKADAKRRQFSKEQEIALAHLQKEIEVERWFRFFADHYITDTLKEYVSIVKSAPVAPNQRRSR